MTANGVSITPLQHRRAWPVPHGFGAAVRNGKTVRQSGQILKGIRYVCDFRDAIPDDASEVLFDILADDKYDFIESCLLRHHR